VQITILIHFGAQAVPSLALQWLPTDVESQYLLITGQSNLSATQAHECSSVAACLYLCKTLGVKLLWCCSYCVENC